MALELPNRTVSVFWYLGVDANLAQGDQGNGDLTADIELVARSNAYAPAGIGGESIFTNVYLTLFRSNAAAALNLTLTPIVDGVAQTAIAISRPVVTEPTREVLEIGLSVPYPSAGDPQISTAMRGTWFEVELRSTGAIPVGRYVIEAMELEHEAVTEGRQAINAVP